MAWRPFGALPRGPVTCQACHRVARAQDKSRLIESLLLEVLLLAAIALFFLVPWWQVVIVVLVAQAAIPACLAWAFPLVPMEEFGSPADASRAAWRFWLIAPLGLLATIAVLVAILT